jgi:peptidyl-prolyl cis-trans isomerase SurA
MRMGGHLGAWRSAAAALLLAWAACANAQAPQAPVVMPSVPGTPPVPGTVTTPEGATTVAGKASQGTVSAVPPVLPGMPVAPGSAVDRVVAIVNNELILDSDVAQERRFAALLPYGEAGGPYSRDRAIERLINRDLILQQARLQPGDEIKPAAIEKDLQALRNTIPPCKAGACDTKAGWDAFLATQGFTETTLNELWKQRMEVLAFIEQRFRMGIKISDEQIKTYYDHDLKAQYDAQHATEPPLDSISTRIQEVLLQQQVSNLLGDWLKSLRAQGSVVVLHPGEEAP